MIQRGLLTQSHLNALADEWHGKSGKGSLVGIKLESRLHESHIAFAHQIIHVQSLRLILACDGDDQSEIGCHELVQCGSISAFDSVGQ